MPPSAPRARAKKEERQQNALSTLGLGVGHVARVVCGQPLSPLAHGTARPHTSDAETDTCTHLGSCP